MFIGDQSYKVDDKGRVPLPPKFRQQMKEGVILAEGITEKCITVYPLPEWKRLSAKLAEKAITPEKLRRLIRGVFGSASSATFDGQGRIKLPDSLREHAEIRDTAIVVGANTVVEIWGEDAWKVEKPSAKAQRAQIFESLEA